MTFWLESLVHAAHEHRGSTRGKAFASCATESSAKHFYVWCNHTLDELSLSSWCLSGDVLLIYGITFNLEVLSSHELCISGSLWVDMVQSEHRPRCGD